MTIPGAVDAWSRLIADHGRKPLKELLQPAIAYASDGYPIAPRVQFDFVKQLPILRGNEAAASALLVEGEPPRVGAVQRQPRLAASLELIAEHGRDAFYTGEVAQDMVDALRTLGGLHTSR